MRAGRLLLDRAVAPAAVRGAHALDDERAHSDRLLSYTMPQRALARLKRGDTDIADAFLEAVVLFVDLAGFTDLSKRLGPRETVRVLDRIFSRVRRDRGAARP